MRKRMSLIASALLLAVCLTGCSFVKVVPIGEEAQYTGEKVFDSAEESSNDWDGVVNDIKEKAQDFAELMKGDGVGKDVVAVSGSAKVIEFNTETPKHFLLIEAEGGVEVKVQAGGVYSGTTVRDAQTVKGFEDFTNQTEWSQYAKALNKEVDARIVAPLALDESAAGKTVTFVGAAVDANGTVTITPVELSIE